jgi:hypothetical protein
MQRKITRGSLTSLFPSLGAARSLLRLGGCLGCLLGPVVVLHVEVSLEGWHMIWVDVAHILYFHIVLDRMMNTEINSGRYCQWLSRIRHDETDRLLGQLPFAGNKLRLKVIRIRDCVLLGSYTRLGSPFASVRKDRPTKLSSRAFDEWKILTLRSKIH